MSRFALAIASTLIAVTAFAQSDPRTNTRGIPLDAKSPRLGSLGESQRIAGHVGVGQRAPDFELQAAGGVPFRLKQTRGGWVALFFTDGREDLGRISTLAHTLDSLHFRTFVVCPEREHVLTVWSAANHSPLTPLADERGDISALYGTWDNALGIPRQAVFLLDPQGVVRLALLDQKVAPPSLVGLVQTAVDGL